MGSGSYVLLLLHKYVVYASLNADTNEGIPSTVGSTGRFDFVGIVPWPLMCDLVCVNQTRRICGGGIVG